MALYVIRRVLYAIPILAGVSLFTFFLFYMTVTPAQMARMNLSAKNPSQTQIQQWISEHGYDKPQGQQFVSYMSNLFMFRFGNSDRTNEPIAKRLREGIGPSLQLQAIVFVGGLITDIFFAIYFAY